MLKRFEPATIFDVIILTLFGINVVIYSNVIHSVIFISLAVVYLTLKVFTESRAMNTELLFKYSIAVLIGYYIYILSVFESLVSFSFSSYALLEALKLITFIVLVLKVIILGIQFYIEYNSGSSTDSNNLLGEEQRDNSSFVNTIQPQGKSTNWAERAFISTESRRRDK